MNNKDIENALKKSYALQPSDTLKDKVIASASVKTVKARRPLFSVKGLVPVLAIFLVAIGLFAYDSISRSIEYETVYFDINPSFSLTVNKGLRVIDSECFNEDAEKCFENAEFKGDKIEKAVNTACTFLEQNGYFENGELYISVCGENVKQNVLDAVKNAIKSYEGTSGIKVTVSYKSVTNDIVEKARLEGISPLRYQMIADILKRDAGYTKEELIELDILGLKQIAETDEKQENKTEKQEDTAEKEAPKVEDTEKAKDEDKSQLFEQPKAEPDNTDDSQTVEEPKNNDDSQTVEEPKGDEGNSNESQAVEEPIYFALPFYNSTSQLKGPSTLSVTASNREFTVNEWTGNFDAVSSIDISNDCLSFSLQYMFDESCVDPDGAIDNLRYGDRVFEDTDERFAELSKHFTVTVNAEIVRGEMNYMQGNGVRYYEFYFSSKIVLADITSLEITMGK